MSTVLTSEEMNLLKELQARYVHLVQKCGELYYQKKILLREIDQVDVSMETLNDDRENLLKELEKKYGVGTVNVETGEFSPEV